MDIVMSVLANVAGNCRRSAMAHLNAESIEKSNLLRLVHYIFVLGEEALGEILKIRRRPKDVSETRGKKVAMDVRFHVGFRLVIPSPPNTLVVKPRLGP